MAENAWQTTIFQSGTTIAKKGSSAPHFYVVGCPGYTDEQMAKMRFEVAEEICRWMNGEKPKGGIIAVENFTPEGNLVLSSGIQIHATGPVYDAEPPKLCWTQLETEEAREQRRALIQDLVVKMLRKPPR